jgi:Asp-tRNA(Asn)/Glu-tRNA(Gln) amidotransferase A subunit family amidase
VVEALLLQPAVELARLIHVGKLSPVELVDASLRRIDEVNPRVNAFCAVYADEARAEARRAEQAVVSGTQLGALHGLPIAIKDFTPLRGKVTTRGSAALRDWIPQCDPVIVERLRSAGAIILGRTTTSELAFSSFTDSLLHGITRNPCDPARTPGGSSGGSAVAVATGCVALAEGTDMGGSVRIPAALCGIVGFKPSLGRIPMDILPTVFDSISHFGPLARCVDDAALFTSVAHGPDDRDIQSLMDRLRFEIPLQRDAGGKRIALSADLGFFAVDGEVRRNLCHAADALRERGFVVQEVDLGWTREVTDAWFAYWAVAQAASFGHLLDSFREAMDPELVRLMDKGLAMGAVDFKRLETVRTRQWHSLARVFADHEALLCPTTAVPAPPVGMDDSDFDWSDEAGRYHGLDMTCPFNNVGQCPAISVPSGRTAAGLPTGAQLVGRRYQDVELLQTAAALEDALRHAS